MYSRRSGVLWTFQRILKASNAGAGDYFGHSVSVSGTTIVVGAYQESSSAKGVNGPQDNDNVLYSGAAYVFVKDGTDWTQEAYLKACGSDMIDEFGYSVSISGVTIVVGAPWEDSDATGVNGDPTNNAVDGSGAAYVFVRDETEWTQRGYLKASAVQGTINFG
jgi:hypothetical protein